VIGGSGGSDEATSDLSVLATEGRRDEEKELYHKDTKSRRRPGISREGRVGAPWIAGW